MKKLSTEQLKAMRDRGEKFTLVNVLAAEKFKETQILGAVNIPLETKDFAKRVEQAAGARNRRVVVYCASEQCPASTQATEQLEKAGFTDVYDFKGGAQAWRESEQMATHHA